MSIAILIRTNGVVDIYGNVHRMESNLRIKKMGQVMVNHANLHFLMIQKRYIQTYEICQKMFHEMILSLLAITLLII